MAITEESELEAARDRIRSATKGLEPADRLYAAVSALVRDDNRQEIAVTNPHTGQVAYYLTPATVKYMRDATTQDRRRRDIPDVGDAKADAVLKPKPHERRGR